MLEGRVTPQESKKTEKGAKKRPKRQSWWQKAALEALWGGFGQWELVYDD